MNTENILKKKYLILYLRKFKLKYFAGNYQLNNLCSSSIFVLFSDYYQEFICVRVRKKCFIFFSVKIKRNEKKFLSKNCKRNYFNSHI